LGEGDEAMLTLGNTGGNGIWAELGGHPSIMETSSDSEQVRAST
jgi:hypothetical protein